MGRSNSLNWIVVVIGIWEGLAPFILGYSGYVPALWNAIIVGVLLIILAAWSALTNDLGTKRALDWINVVIGAWLVISPFVLGYTAAGIVAGVWNAIIVGIVVIILEIWAALSLPSQTTV